MDNLYQRVGNIYLPVFSPITKSCSIGSNEPEVMGVIGNKDYEQLAEFIVEHIDISNYSDIAIFNHQRFETDNQVFTINGSVYFNKAKYLELWGIEIKIENVDISCLLIETQGITDFDGSILKEYIDCLIL